MSANVYATVSSLLPASFPSPDVLEDMPGYEDGVWQLGPVPLRAYALCIVLGIVVAIVLGSRRWVARGGSPQAVSDIAIWAVPFGIVGARIYHVITDNQLYFGEGSRPWYEAFYIWEGGIGIWGAVAGGALGVWIACRLRNIPFLAMADALAPGVLIAQAIGRWGNWFNQELYGKPTDLPWALEVAPRKRPDEYLDVETFHPTFLYESLWALAVALLIIWADRRFTLGHGRVLALYVAGYTLGRSLFEYLRIDPANEILGLRVNQWVSGLLFVVAIGFFVWSARRHPGREAPESLMGTYAADDPSATAGDENAAAEPEAETGVGSVTTADAPGVADSGDGADSDTPGSPADSDR